MTRTMSDSPRFEIFLVAVPGLEAALCEEAREARFGSAKLVAGGVTIHGRWPDVWRANLQLRGASRIIARIASFRAMHLAQLDKRTRRVPWAEILRPDVPFRVETTCHKSRIYHSGAASQRIERAIREELGAEPAKDAGVVVKARIDDDLCTIGIDTSGEPLHKRGHKEAVAKAPMRETMAALFLRQCGYAGGEPVLDPMCGSGTFVIEAAEIAAGLLPGRSRHFAFEHLATFDAAAWSKLRDATAIAVRRRPAEALRFQGSDRDGNAVAMSRDNAKRAGIDGLTHFAQSTVSEITPPPGPAGLVIVNPPYGDRIGDKAALTALYRALGQTLKAGFIGWRVGIVTNEEALARATGLPLQKPFPTVLHGGIRVTLYVGEPLA